MSAPSTPKNTEGHCVRAPASVSKSVRQQLQAGSLTNYMPASYVNIQSAMHKRLGLDFPGCLRGKLIAERPELLTPPDLFEAFKLHNSKKYKEYIHLMSAQQRDELYAFKDETMDRIQAGDYNDPPKNFMDGAATRSEQWNYLTPTIKLKYIVQCDDPQLHQDKYVAAVELCKKHFFAMSCAILDKAVIELEQLDIYETKMQDVIFMRARRVKRAAEESANNKEKLKQIRLFEEALCKTLEEYELKQPVMKNVLYTENEGSPAENTDVDYSCRSR